MNEDPLEVVIARLTEHFLDRMIPEPPAIIGRGFWMGQMTDVQLEAVARDVKVVLDELKLVTQQRDAVDDNFEDMVKTWQGAEAELDAVHLSTAEIDDIRWLVRRVQEQAANDGYSTDAQRDNARADRIAIALSRLERDRYMEDAPRLSPERLKRNAEIIAANIEREKALPDSKTSVELEREQ